MANFRRFWPEELACGQKHIFGQISCHLKKNDKNWDLLNKFFREFLRNFLMFFFTKK
jgi:hypothetical protein